jgi:hypothetical protein
MKMSVRWIILITIIASLSRLFFLASSPPGFYIDEAAGATNAICFAQTHASELGDRWPIFFAAFDRSSGAFFTAPYIYPVSVWLEVFGTSAAAFRGFVALCSVLSILALFLLGKTLRDAETGWYVALAASISPWIFQFSRIAWDPPVAMMFLAWSLYFLFSAIEIWSFIVSGGLLAVSAYAYPPLRAQIILLIPALLWVRWRLKESTTTTTPVVSISAWLGGLGFVSIPLALAIISGEIQGRFNFLSVFAPGVLQERYHNGSPIFGLILLLKNFFAHLTPSFLLLAGDSNLRHSTGRFGILSWLDAFAVILFISLILKWLRLRKEGSAIKIETRNTFLIPALGLFGFFTGIGAASLTWEGIPHALRSLGGSPFLAIFTGFVLRESTRKSERMKFSVAVIATLFFTCFAWIYFGEYKTTSELWFDQPILDSAKQAAITHNWQGFVQSANGYQDSALKYHFMNEGHFTCEQVRQIFKTSK